MRRHSLRFVCKKLSLCTVITSAPISHCAKDRAFYGSRISDGCNSVDELICGCKLHRKDSTSLVSEIASATCASVVVIVTLKVRGTLLRNGYCVGCFLI